MTPPSYQVPAPSSDPNVEDSVNLLRARSHVGLRKYGCDTTRLSASESCEHARQEAGDLLNYLTQMKKRIEWTEGELERLQYILAMAPHSFDCTMIDRCTCWKAAIENTEPEPK